MEKNHDCVAAIESLLSMMEEKNIFLSWNLLSSFRIPYVAFVKNKAPCWVGCKLGSS